MFMIAIDTLSPMFDPVAVKERLKASPVIESWWHHIPGCFLVIASADADQITDEVRKATGDARLLVIEVNPAHSEGWMPPRSWDWIRRRENEHAQ